MARNEEKAQSMLYRFREAQAAELGFGRISMRRPGYAGTVNSIPEAERWRRDVLSEISRKIAKIQDVGLSDFQVRDLNDDINKLMGTKYHWEMRIKELGGADYTRAGPRMISFEGREVPGTRGYKYFGRARDLPGVRELFEQAAPEPPSRSLGELYRNIDADYYGYRDEEDGTLLEYEKQLEQELTAKLANMPDQKIEESMDVDEEETEQTDNKPAVQEQPVPSQKEVEAYLIQRRRQELLDKYVSEDLKQNEEETKELIA